MGEYFVFRIDSMKIKQVKIELGSNLGEMIVVKKGLSPGDKIVVDGLQKVHHGSMVQVSALSAK
jgi:membrane fusion protein (multidrug efflux system)